GAPIAVAGGHPRWHEPHGGGADRRHGPTDAARPIMSTGLRAHCHLARSATEALARPQGRDAWSRRVPILRPMALCVGGASTWPALSRSALGSKSTRTRSALYKIVE